MILLRPHHGLCIRFFEGKGYSGEFTEHMEKTIERLQEPDTRIVLIKEEDEICKKCPNFLENGCKSKEKVCAYDDAVLEKTALTLGVPMEYRTFQQKIGEHIIDAGGLRGICADCGWAEICHNK